MHFIFLTKQNAQPDDIAYRLHYYGVIQEIKSFYKKNS